MIEYIRGNILHSEAEALVNTVNCVGVMGRGIALQFKNAYPDNFKAYVSACQRSDVQPGRMFVFATGELGNPKHIINFPTKRHWRAKSRMEDIEAGLTDLARVIERLDIRSVAIPPLGSGLGGLRWEDVKPRIERALQLFSKTQVFIYEPVGAPTSDTMIHKGEPPKMTAGRAALVVLISRYLRGLLDPSVSLLEVHKLMYFLQEAGEPLRLRFKAAHYGPYAENLRHVLSAIEGHFVTGYADGGDAPDKILELVPGAQDDASQFLGAHEATRSRFDRVADLVQGFESPFGLELLSTVHWITRTHGARSTDEIAQHVYAWSERKRRFTPRQIDLAMNVLTEKGWGVTSTAA